MKVIHKESDITDYVSTISWKGSRSEVARKLELQIINAPLDKNISPLNIGLADMVYLYDDENEELFRGYVTDREANSNNGIITYTAYDLLYYTLKSTATYNFKDKTAEAITKAVCNDMEIPVKNLAKTKLKQKLIVQDKSIYKIIMQAYTNAYEKNDTMYRVCAKKGYLTVEEMGNVVCKIQLTDDTNIISSKYRESLNNMVNKVLIYNSTGKKVGVVQKKKDLKYGIFQKTYTEESGKNAKETAKSMFNGVEKTFDLDCINLNEAVTGSGIIIKDSTTGLSGLVWIDADTHTWKNGVATMSLTVTLKNMMDAQED